MLRVTIPEIEMFSNATNEFTTIPGGEVILEHSLLSVSKWEAKHHKYFLNNRELNNSEIIDYIRCMTVKGNIDDRLYNHIPMNIIAEIMDYMNDSMTATWFGSNNQGRPGHRLGGKVLTSELLYYYMISYNIPISCEKWHINRLLTLIQVCQAEQNPKKLTGKALAERNSKLNEERRKKFHSNG